MTEFEKQEHFEITGFHTPEEWSAYMKGQENMESVIWQFINNWKGETNSRMGQLLAEKVKCLKSL